MTGSELAQRALEEAANTAERSQCLEAEFQKKRFELEIKEAEVKAAGEAAAIAHERARNFVPVINHELQCPRCWVKSGRHISLTAIGRALGENAGPPS